MKEAEQRRSRPFLEVEGAGGSACGRKEGKGRDSHPKESHGHNVHSLLTFDSRPCPSLFLYRPNLITTRGTAVADTLAALVHRISSRKEHRPPPSKAKDRIKAPWASIDLLQ